MVAPAQPNPLPVRLPGFAAIAAQFDGFIVDQWGVLHDGVNPYPGAPECLKRLRAHGRVIVLSNSGKLTAENMRRMAAVGFPRETYDALISAGQDARDAILTRADSFYKELGSRCYALRRSDDDALLSGLGLDFVTRVEDAEFLLVVSLPESHGLVDRYRAVLETAVAHGLPMVCANPDVWRVSGADLAEAPGILARCYEGLGGTVRYHGKPHLPIYLSCLKHFPGIPRGRILGIGDSVEHDIAGARGAGMVSALTAGGIHAEELGVGPGELPDADRWSTFAKAAPAIPDYLLPGFVW